MTKDLASCIILHEGYKKYAYLDSRESLTIGIGRNIDSKSGKGLSDDEIMYLFKNDIKSCEIQLMKLDFYKGQDIVRKEALIELCFNLGLSGLLKFHKMLNALVIKDYEKAIMELKNSLWATQVQEERVKNICSRLLTGSYQ